MKSPESVSGARPDPADARDFYVDTNYRIRHEDEAILVVEKPAPLATHPVGAYRELNLYTLLINEPGRGPGSVKMVHRLDAETSGLIVAAKTAAAARSLGLQFMNGRVHKEYEAILFGAPEPRAGTVEYALGYDRSTRFRLIRCRDDREGEPARTEYETLAVHGPYSLVRLRPSTGRAHQLRIHMALIGHPIVGDKIYKNPELFDRYRRNGLDDGLLEELKSPRLALHATRIAFGHPLTGAEAAFESGLPAALSGLLP